MKISKGFFNKGIKSININVKPTGYKLDEEMEEVRRQEVGRCNNKGQICRFSMAG
jgi:hypothetical protein